MTDLKHRQHTGFTLLELMIAVSIIALLVTLALPAIIKPMKRARVDVCVQNQRVLDGAKVMWALEFNKSEDDLPTFNDLDPYTDQKVGHMTCPEDDANTMETSYDLKSVGEPCSCKINPGTHVH